MGEPEALGGIYRRIAEEIGGVIPSSTSEKRRRQSKSVERQAEPEETCSRCHDTRSLTFWASEFEMRTLPCPDCLRPSRFMLENFKPVKGTEKALHAIKDFISGDGEPWLILSGGNGCGKTHLARGTLYALLKAFVAVSYFYATDIIDSLSYAAQFKGEISLITALEATYMSSTVLIIDDLGAERETGWVRERLEKIFNHRYEARSHTLITTNLAIEEFPSAIASRMSDREVARIVYIGAADYRITRSPERDKRVHKEGD